MGLYFSVKINFVSINYIFAPVRQESYNLPFTEKEFDSALAKCGDTAPGPDDIPYAMLRHCTAGTKTFICDLFSRMWRESNFPSAWELATVLPFAKPGKDSTVPSNYWPIALTSSL